MLAITASCFYCVAGVSAAFDAPATGALFAVEFVLKSSRLGLDRLSTSTVFASTSVAAGAVGFLRGQGRALGITGAATHLVGRIPYFSIQPNLLIDVFQVCAATSWPDRQNYSHMSMQARVHKHHLTKEYVSRHTACRVFMCQAFVGTVECTMYG